MGTINMKVEPYHPRRRVIGALLRHVLPMPDDKEAQDERRLIHRIELREAVRGR